MEAAVSDLQAWTCIIYAGLPAALCARETLLFFMHYGLFGGATCGVSVWNGERKEKSTASVHYLYRVLD